MLKRTFKARFESHYIGDVCGQILNIRFLPRGRNVLPNEVQHLLLSCLAQLPRGRFASNSLKFPCIAKNFILLLKICFKRDWKMLRHRTQH